jgi:predicted kinase
MAPSHRMDARVNDHLCVVLVSGLPAVGKSTLVAELSPRLGAVALSRDQARLAARGAARLVDTVSFKLLHRRLRRVQRRAGRALIAELGRHLAAGRSVTVEAVAEAAFRRELQHVAEQHGAEFAHVECVCSDAREYRRRLAQRPAFWLNVVRRVAPQYDPPGHCLKIDTVEPPRQAASRILAQLNR